MILPVLQFKKMSLNTLAWRATRLAGRKKSGVTKFKVQTYRPTNCYKYRHP